MSLDEATLQKSEQISNFTTNTCLLVMMVATSNLKQPTHQSKSLASIGQFGQVVLTNSKPKRQCKDGKNCKGKDWNKVDIKPLRGQAGINSNEKGWNKVEINALSEQAGMKYTNSLKMIIGKAGINGH